MKSAGEIAEDVLALLAKSQPLTLAEIAVHTGFAEEDVRKAFKLLSEIGMVQVRDGKVKVEPILKDMLLESE